MSSGSCAHQGDLDALFTCAGSVRRWSSSCDGGHFPEEYSLPLCSAVHILVGCSLVIVDRRRLFCFDCDAYLHERLHNCPGCEALPGHLPSEDQMDVG